MKYIFGPINSRRFGKSLGIDLSPDIKSCNFDCLYCELNRRKPVNKIENEPSVEDIIREVKNYLENNLYPDVITITANGEPTLYSKLDRLIDELNKIKGKSKLLILSNGSTIDNEAIRKTLKKLDMVKISLDAVDQKLFKKIDRPLENIEVKNIIDGLKKFRKEFDKDLIIEIIVVKNINDTEENIEEIAKELIKIKPDRVDLGTIDRPPAYRVNPVSNERLLELAEILKRYNLPVNVVLRRNENTETIYKTIDELLETLKRRPLTVEEIESSSTKEVLETVKKLLKDGKLTEEQVRETRFISISKNKL